MLLPRGYDHLSILCKLWVWKPVRFWKETALPHKVCNRRQHDRYHNSQQDNSKAKAAWSTNLHRTPHKQSKSKFCLYFSKSPDPVSQIDIYLNCRIWTSPNWKQKNSTTSIHHTPRLSALRKLTVAVYNTSSYMINFAHLLQYITPVSTTAATLQIFPILGTPITRIWR
jgi:hypothetical protein